MPTLVFEWASRKARASSTSQRNTFVNATPSLKRSAGETNPQRLPRALVQLKSDSVQVGLGEWRQIGLPREVLSKKAIRVLICASLPGTLRITEIHLDVSCDRELLVPS